MSGGSKRLPTPYDRQCRAVVNGELCGVLFAVYLPKEERYHIVYRGLQIKVSEHSLDLSWNCPKCGTQNTL